MYICVRVYTYIYIYIYIERESIYVCAVLFCFVILTFPVESLLILDMNADICFNAETEVRSHICEPLWLPDRGRYAMARPTSAVRHFRQRSERCVGRICGHRVYPRLPASTRVSLSLSLCSHVRIYVSMHSCISLDHLGMHCHCITHVILPDGLILSS